LAGANNKNAPASPSRRQKQSTESKFHMNTTHPGIAETVKEKSEAAIKGSGNVVETTVDAAGKVITTTVKDTAKVGGEVGAAATGLVTGAVEDVKKVAVKTEHATAAVAGGALKAVGEVGSSAVDAVRTTVTKPGQSDKAGKKEPETASRN